MGQVRPIEPGIFRPDVSDGHVIMSGTLHALKQWYVIEEDAMNPGHNILRHIRDFPASAPPAPNAPVITATPNYQVAFTLTQDPDNWHNVSLFEWVSGDPIEDVWVPPGGTAGFFNPGVSYNGVQVFARAFRVATQGGPYPSPNSSPSNVVTVSVFGG